MIQTVTAVVPAAGIGSRMLSEKPKQYLQLGQHTVIEQTLHRLLTYPRIDQVIVVISPQDSFFHSLAIAEHPKITVTTGGRERADSVLSGLQLTTTEWVMVHDAARPCVTANDLTALIHAAELSEQHGAILAKPVSDTIKKMNSAQCIAATVDRSLLWHALTPQLFPTQQLRQAISHALQQQQPITDEASAMELAGYQPQLVHGRSDNIKITVPEDLALATFILQQQEH
jgi:2-C-methyl-D-erythritol 4-phosphate cytidylyltransferase